MEMTVEEIARLVNGYVEGDSSRVISTFAPIEEAAGGSITFFSNPKYVSYLYTTQAEAILISKDYQLEKPCTASLIRVDDVYSTLSSLLEKFSQTGINKEGIENPVHIAETASVGRKVYLGAFSYIGENSKIANRVKIFPQVFIGDNVTIDEGTVIFAGVKIYAGTKIGSNCILHSGCVIGSDGFGFAPQEDGTYRKIPQSGSVTIHNDVEIGANTTIDRATLKETILHSGVKLDNLVHIAHNVEVGPNTAMAAQVGISGSTRLGKGVVIGGQAGIVGHISIADGVMIAAKAGISKTIVEKNSKWFGAPADEYKNAIRAQVIFKKLPELYRRIQELENKKEAK